MKILALKNRLLTIELKTTSIKFFNNQVALARQKKLIESTQIYAGLNTEKVFTNILRAKSETKKLNLEMLRLNYQIDKLTDVMQTKVRMKKNIEEKVIEEEMIEQKISNIVQINNVENCKDFSTLTSTPLTPPNSDKFKQIVIYVGSELGNVTIESVKTENFSILNFDYQGLKKKYQDTFRDSVVKPIKQKYSKVKVTENGAS